MDAVEYIKELSRMCQYYTERKKCDISCPFDFFCQNARYRDAKNSEAMVNAVENWREEHPKKTNGQVMLDYIKKFVNDTDGGFTSLTMSPRIVLEFDQNWWCKEYKE